MSTLKAAIISDELDNTLGMQELISGASKAFLAYNQLTSTNNVSLNVSSVVDVSVGNDTVNLTSSMSAANYPVSVTGSLNVANGGHRALGGAFGKLVGSYGVSMGDNNNTTTAQENLAVCDSIVVGSLA